MLFNSDKRCLILNALAYFQKKLREFFKPVLENNFSGVENKKRHHNGKIDFFFPKLLFQIHTIFGLQIHMLNQCMIFVKKLINPFKLFNKKRQIFLFCIKL